MRFLLTLVLITVITLVGCSSQGESSGGNKEGKQTVVDVKPEEKAEDTTPTEEEELSYAKKHPEIDQDIVEMFSLDKEYSESASEFFELGWWLYAEEQSEDVDYIDFYAESQENAVLRVKTNQYYRFLSKNEMKFDAAYLSFEITTSEEKQMYLESEVENKQAVEYDASKDSSDFFVELAEKFDSVFTYSGTLDRNEYILYKFIPLNDGFELKIKLIGDKHSLSENIEEVNYRLDNIIINPVLTEV